MAAREDEQAAVSVRVYVDNEGTILTSVHAVTRSTELEEVVDTTRSESSHAGGNEVSIDFLQNC
jgi:hypothetical protein